METPAPSVVKVSAVTQVAPETLDFTEKPLAKSASAAKRTYSSKNRFSARDLVFVDEDLIDHMFQSVTRGSSLKVNKLSVADGDGQRYVIF